MEVSMSPYHTEESLKNSVELAVRTDSYFKFDEVYVEDILAGVSTLKAFVREGLRVIDYLGWKEPPFLVLIYFSADGVSLSNLSVNRSQVGTDRDSCILRITLITHQRIQLTAIRSTTYLLILGCITWGGTSGTRAVE
jgi:hypothetical protein